MKKKHLIAMAFDESKHKRGAKGTKQGGQFVRKEEVEEPYSAEDLSEGADIASAHAKDGPTHGSAAHFHKRAAAAHQALGNTEKAKYHLDKKKYHDDVVNKMFELKWQAAKKKDTSLSFDFDVLSLSQEESETKATKNPLVFWKEVAREGKFFKRDQEINITSQHLKHWENTFGEMSQLGIEVPVPVEHNKDPEKRRGTVKALKTKPNKQGVPALYAKIEFRDEEAAKLRTSGCSIFVPKETPSGDGRVFKSAVEHICITDYPVIPGLEPFSETIALSHKEPVVATTEVVDNSQLILTKLKTNFKTRTGRELELSDELALSSLVLDGAVRSGDLDEIDVISLSFPPKPGEAPAAPAPGGQPVPTAPTQQQQPTLRQVADQLGIDPNITDQNQLIAMLLQAVTQLKARTQQAPAAPAAPRPMMPARPPMAMSLGDLLPADVLMSLSKKKLKKIKKHMKENMPSEEEGELKCALTEPAPVLEIDDEDESELQIELSMPAALLETVKTARQATIDNLFSTGYLTGAGRTELINNYINSDAVALSHTHDDGFNAAVKLIQANGKVLSMRSKTGPQAEGLQVLELSQGINENPLMADAQRRARGETSI